MPDTTKWIVTTSGNPPLQDVARQLSGAGFAIEQVLDGSDALQGRPVRTWLRRCARSRVADVSPEQSIDIGPPDAPVTW